MLVNCYPNVLNWIDFWKVKPWYMRIKLMVCYFILVCRPILTHYKITQPIQLSSKSIWSSNFWWISEHSCCAICNAETFVLIITRQYFVNEDDTVPQKVKKMLIDILHCDVVVNGEFTSSYPCSYRWLFRRIAGGGFTSVVLDLVRG